MLHSSVMQVIMTQILKLTATQLSGTAGDFLQGTVVTGELCAVQVGGQGCCRARLHIICWEGYIRGQNTKLVN